MTVLEYRETEVKHEDPKGHSVHFRCSAKKYQKKISKIVKPAN